MCPFRNGQHFECSPGSLEIRVQILALAGSLDGHVCYVVHIPRRTNDEGPLAGGNAQTLQARFRPPHPSTLTVAATPPVSIRNLPGSFSSRSRTSFRVITAHHDVSLRGDIAVTLRFDDMFSRQQQHATRIRNRQQRAGPDTCASKGRTSMATDCSRDPTTAITSRSSGNRASA